ncbi:MAG: hypothetical protein ACFFC7_10925 [Candidatus Hermodarchaeota archaeon]
MLGDEQKNISIRRSNIYTMLDKGSFFISLKLSILLCMVYPLEVLYENELVYGKKVGKNLDPDSVFTKETINPLNSAKV